jgi:hypothetical protein
MQAGLGWVEAFTLRRDLIGLQVMSAAYAGVLARSHCTILRGGGRGMKREMVVRVVEIRAYDDGVLGHGLTHRVTLLSREDDGTIHTRMEVTTADPGVHDVWREGGEYRVTFEPVRPARPAGQGK